MNTQELKPINKAHIENICNSVEVLLERSLELKTIVTTMCEYADIYIIGGSLRDVVNDNIVRDIDIIYRPTKDFSIEKLQCKYSLNNFGGFKILSDIEIDFWSFENNWYFKNFLSNPTPEDITYGTFLNVNSLVLDYKKRSLYYDYYNICANNKEIDFVSHDLRYINSNPNRPLNVVNCFALKNKYNLNFSDMIKVYLLNWYNANGDMNILLNEEKRHYKQQINTLEQYKSFFDELM